MSAAPARLERGYRRLVAGYPAAHRREHEEEMVGVLLAAARDGQRRPRPSEAVNLAWGALRIRLRRAPVDARFAAWRDALAVFSVAAPLLLVMLTAGTSLTCASPCPAGFTTPFLQPPAMQEMMYGQIALLVLIMLRLRWASAVLAVAIAGICVGAVVLTDAYDKAAVAFCLLLTVAEAAALIVSPGPRRGLALLRRGWGLLALLAVAAVALAALGEAYGHIQLASSTAWADAANVVIALLAIVLAVGSPLTRRLLLLFAIPAIPFVYSVTEAAAETPYINSPTLATTVFCLPLVLVTAAIITAAVRARHRPAAGRPVADRPQ